jgi:hypothetical protein
VHLKRANGRAEATLSDDWVSRATASRTARQVGPTTDYLNHLSCVQKSNRRRHRERPLQLADDKRQPIQSAVQLVLDLVLVGIASYLAEMYLQRKVDFLRVNTELIKQRKNVVNRVAIEGHR